LANLEQVIVIRKNNEPIAELHALPEPNSRLRPWGIDRGVFTVPDDINAPLADDDLAAWETSSVKR
jgi:hypothetical protein